MIVVADTSPLNYLILIEHVEVLRELYTSVLIPPAVHMELLASHAPDPVRAWAAVPPSWVEIRTPSTPLLSVSAKLGLGEHEALTLAQTLTAPLLLIDEIRGRREARRLGIRVTGTLGILQEAHDRHFLNLREAIDRLRHTTFQATSVLLDGVLRDAGLL
jgi:predicted nucleic acid-binding protein